MIECAMCRTEIKDGEECTCNLLVKSEDGKHIMVSGTSTIPQQLDRIESRFAELLELLTCDDCDNHDSPDDLARQFHEIYERLAPNFGYKTREASAVPWENVPDNNKRLMIAVCKELFFNDDCDCEDEE